MHSSLQDKDDEPKEPLVRERNATKLSPREMYRFSRQIGVQWYILDGLMDIEQVDRDNIRANHTFIDDVGKAEKILSMFNKKKDFTRDKLVECLKGIKKMNLIEPVTTGAWQNLIVQNS